MMSRPAEAVSEVVQRLATPRDVGSKPIERRLASSTTQNPPKTGAGMAAIVIPRGPFRLFQQARSLQRHLISRRGTLVPLRRGEHRGRTGCGDGAHRDRSVCGCVGGRARADRASIRPIRSAGAGGALPRGAARSGGAQERLATRGGDGRGRAPGRAAPAHRRRLGRRRRPRRPPRVRRRAPRRRGFRCPHRRRNRVPEEGDEILRRGAPIHGHGRRAP